MRAHCGLHFGSSACRKHTGRRPPRRKRKGPVQTAPLPPDASPLQGAVTGCPVGACVHVRTAARGLEVGGHLAPQRLWVVMGRGAR